MKKISLFIAIILSSLSCSQKVDYYLPAGKKRVRTGLENFIRYHADEYSGKKAIIVTNHSGVNFNLRQNIRLLEDNGINVYLAMAPEHGIYGYQNEYSEENYHHDKNFNTFVYNMHMLSLKELKFILTSADVVFFDIQDMGMRCYTYIANLKYIIDCLQNSKTELVVLDRPNPIGFIGTDGPPLEKNCITQYVSAFPAPFIYNMTIGESALYYSGEFAPKIKLKVIEMSGYNRDSFYHNTALPWVPPSPNLPTYESSIVYASIVLLEGLNISLGRGTTKPFEYIGAPWINAADFCRELRSLGLKNFRFRPVYFKPTFNKYKDETCGGVQIFYTGGNFSPTEVSYRIISFIRKKYPKAEWTKFKKWYDIDYLCGTKQLRKYIDQGKSFNDFRKRINPGLEKYEDKREQYLLY